jgi:regulator of protease activity HflC (stomatin/prohibitin superfamily)
MARIGGASFDAQGFGRSLKRLVFVGIAIVVVMYIGCSTTRRIDAGHVGVLVKMTGNERGVQNDPILPGWAFYNPLTEQIVQFPTSVQNVVWTASPHEGKPVDESITFSSNEGANVNADVGLSFHVEPKLAPKLYERFRQTDLIALAAGYMRNTVRESFNEVASKMPVVEIYGAGKSKMLNEVTTKCRDVFAKDGIVIDQLTLNSALRLPQLIADAINRSLEANQNALQSKNKVAQVEAEAQQAITQAHGAAEAARQKAQGEADALLIRARAEAQANEIIRLSMTASVLQYRALERWDGKLPTYQTGGNVPLLTFDIKGADFGMKEQDRQKRLEDLMNATAPKSASGSSSAAPPPPPAAPAPASSAK